MKESRLMAFALAIAVIVVAMIVAGCSTTSTPTPTPTPTPTVNPTPTPTPTLSPVENQYQYVEHFSHGIDRYNAGIELMRTAGNYNNTSDYANASRYMLLASDEMTGANGNFTDMLWYASGNQEILLAQKWAEAADYAVKSYQNASRYYTEYAIQLNRSTPNPVMYNYYASQANNYNGLSLESRRQADALQANMTFVVPTPTPAP